MTLPPDPRSTYDAHDPAEDSPRAAKHALVRSVKRLIELTAHLDVHAGVDLGEVDALSRDIDAVSDRLEPMPSLHAKGGLGSVGGDDGALLERSGISGRSFDDLMGSTQTLSGLAGYTGTLTVRMIRPTPLGRRIDYAAGVTRVDGRKIYVWGTADCEGTRLAEAEIVFIAPRGGRRPR